LSLTASSEFSLTLCDIIFQYNFAQLIDQPTHKQGNILDLFITEEISIPMHAWYVQLIAIVQSELLLTYHK